MYKKNKRTVRWGEGRPVLQTSSGTDLRTPRMEWWRLPCIFLLHHMSQAGPEEAGHLETLMSTDKTSPKKHLFSLVKGTDKGQPNKAENS